MKSDFLILFIKEDIINGVENNFIVNKLIKNKYILEIFFIKKIFRKKTKININGKYYSLREYCKLTNNKELKRLLLNLLTFKTPSFIYNVLEVLTVIS
jgi:hypothetical protein